MLQVYSNIDIENYSLNTINKKKSVKQKKIN